MMQNPIREQISSTIKFSENMKVQQIIPFLDCFTEIDKTIRNGDKPKCVERNQKQENHASCIKSLVRGAN